MTANELRIGNWVMCQFRGEYKPHAIKSIYFNDEEKLYFVELDNGFQCNVNGISPIELTNELLENMGFQLTDKPIVKTDLRLSPHFVYRKSIENTHIDIDPVQLFILEKGTGKVANICDVRHLHQIQNAYYVVIGEELNIEL
jgi:hypothetical protein